MYVLVVLAKTAKAAGTLKFSITSPQYIPEPVII
jgi:hypothetical protein